MRAALATRTPPLCARTWPATAAVPSGASSSAGRARGAWTARALALISRKPGVVSTELARELGLPRFEFKRRVRRLKELGLTESLEVGYRISPRGRALLRSAVGSSRELD
jgi:hypothetical protein